MVAFLVLYVGAIVRRGGRGIVAKRGMSIGADLGTLATRPRVLVRSVIQEGPERVRLILTPEADGSEAGGSENDVDLVVHLGDDEFGFGLLHEWKRSQTPIALVLPPDSHIVRLRSIEDLQHLTLRRFD